MYEKGKGVNKDYTKASLNLVYFDLKDARQVSNGVVDEDEYIDPEYDINFKE